MSGVDQTGSISCQAGKQRVTPDTDKTAIATGADGKSPQQDVGETWQVHVLKLLKELTAKKLAEPRPNSKLEAEKSFVPGNH